MELTQTFSSGGRRGAASAEYFLLQGYAVIFLHRKNSLEPFSRRFLVHQSDRKFFKCLTLNEQGEVQSTRFFSVQRRYPGHIFFNADPNYPYSCTVSPEYQDGVKKLMKQVQEVEPNLLQIPFVSLNEYLALLKALSLILEPLGRRYLAYLAAAVSDFHLPMANIVTHKIQSRDGPLKIELEQVPKVLKVLKSTWCPQAFIVTFKLETDEALLEKKARGHLDVENGYGVQAVIGNILGQHQTKVFLILSHDSKLLTFETTQEKELEEPLVAKLVQEHSAYISAGENSK